MFKVQKTFIHQILVLLPLYEIGFVGSLDIICVFPLNKYDFLKIKENRFFFRFRSAKCDKNKSKYFLCKLLFRYFLFMQTPHPCRVMWQS